MCVISIHFLHKYKVFITTFGANYSITFYIQSAIFVSVVGVLCFFL